MGAPDIAKADGQTDEPKPVARTLAEIDPEDIETRDRWDKRQLEEGLERVRANTRRMQEKGILDEHGSSVHEDLPEEMLKGDEPCEVP